MGKGGVERGGGMLLCDWTHFCHPGGTFQLSVATNTAVVG